MNEIRLEGMTLRQFKGMDFRLEPGGRNVDVYGDNATGKTTLFDAWCWLLFGKDSLNRAAFEIKTLGADGQPVHGLNHEVEAVLSVGGESLTLKKSYYEKWVKQTGRTDREFTGHTTDHFVDGVPVKKGEFEARISSLIDEATFKLLSNPRHFCEVMKWQERRALLLTVCGDITDAEVMMAMDPTMADLSTILGRHSLEDHRKILAARKTEINKVLASIPVRIDEATRAMPDIGGMDMGSLEAMLQPLHLERKALAETFARIEAGGEVAQKTKELREVEGRLLDLANKHRASVQAQGVDIRRRIAEIETEVDATTARAREKSRELRENLTDIKRQEQRLESLRTQWESVEANVFIHDVADNCPACGQTLPHERVEAAVCKAQAEFNGNQARVKADILARVKDIKAAISAMETRNGILEAEIKVTETKISDLGGQIETLRTQANAQADVQFPSAERDAMDAEKAIIMAEIETLKAGTREATDRIRAEIAVIDGKIQSVQADIAKIRAAENGRLRIEELKGQERTLAEEFERIERELHMTAEFVRVKVRILEDRINAKFQHARFRMFNLLVNGALEECCDVTMGGVPYDGGLNNSARINVGLDIIRTLSEHYGIAVPIFVDNAEAVTNLWPTPGQQIRLYVSSTDPTLRVEQN